jgi:hypothetical protein
MKRMTIRSSHELFKGGYIMYKLIETFATCARGRVIFTGTLDEIKKFVKETSCRMRPYVHHHVEDEKGNEVYGVL